MNDRKDHADSTKLHRAEDERRHDGSDKHAVTKEPREYPEVPGHASIGTVTIRINIALREVRNAPRSPASACGRWNRIARLAVAISWRCW
jgi:hypothetical protein